MSNIIKVSQNTHPANIKKKRLLGRFLAYIFQFSTVVGIIVLATLLINIINDCFGFVAVAYENSPETIIPDGQSLATLNSEQKLKLIKLNILWD